MAKMSIQITPPGSLSQVVDCYIKQFQNEVERYSNQEVPHSLGKFELQKTVNILEGPYDRKTVFHSVSSFNLQAGVIIIQAHNTPNNILLSVSLKVSDELYAGLDRELCPPGLSYTKSLLSSQDPGSVLWRIKSSEEGVLTFPHCLLPESAYSPEVIQFTFPLEVLSFSPPTADNSEPKILKFNHQRGKLAFCNLSGDPPISNPPLNESKIRHYSTIYNPRSEFQENQQYDGHYR